MFHYPQNHNRWEYVVEDGKSVGVKVGEKDYPHRKERLTFCHFQEKWRKVINKIPPLYIRNPDSYIYNKRIYMCENKYLSGFTPNIIQSGVTFIVDYGLGTCHYVQTKIGKRIKQDVLQLTHCDMWKVITVINEENQLNEGDYRDLNMEIRTHSLRYVEEFIENRLGLVQ